MEENTTKRKILKRKSINALTLGSILKAIDEVSNILIIK